MWSKRSGVYGGVMEMSAGMLWLLECGCRVRPSGMAGRVWRHSAPGERHKVLDVDPKKTQVAQ